MWIVDCGLAIVDYFNIGRITLLPTVKLSQPNLN